MRSKKCERQGSVMLSLFAPHWRTHHGKSIRKGREMKSQDWHTASCCSKHQSTHMLRISLMQKGRNFRVVGLSLVAAERRGHECRDCQEKEDGRRIELRVRHD